MIHNLATIHDNYETYEDQEVTVRAQIQGDPLQDDDDNKILYQVDDPRGDLPHRSFLSLWLDEPPHDGIRETEEYVIEALSTGPGTRPVHSLQRGEQVLIRGTPRRADWHDQDRLYINTTSILIRSPELQIGKGEMGTNEACPRRYYLQFVKNVYRPREPLDGSQLRGDLIHRVAERAINEHLDRFEDHAWTEDTATAFFETVSTEEFGIRKAQAAVSGAGLGSVGTARSAITRLFTDDEFCDRIADTETVATERALGVAYGYRGDIDLVLDGVPYDFKTSPYVHTDDYERQLRLYLFGLLLENAAVGDDLDAALDSVPEGYVVYPNLDDTTSVRFDAVQLNKENARDLLSLRNAVAESRDTFGPPSPYNRDCTNCHFRNETPVIPDQLEEDRPGREPLPSPCTYHCQTERRWACYETRPDGGITSDCSLFDECEQRLEYRDPEQVDHYNRLRAALSTEADRRRTASKLLDQLEEERLIKSGRLLTGLEFSWEDATLTTVSFDTDHVAVPAFEPGEVVEITAVTSGSTSREAIYLGRFDDQYRFQFDLNSHGGFLSEDTTYRARTTFDQNAVGRDYLRYLDYAQRRGHARRFKQQRETATGDEADAYGATDIDEGSQVADYLDNEEVFVDVPVRDDRMTRLGGLVTAVVTADQPLLDADNDETVPSEGQRTLVLGSSPQHVELTQRVLPDGPHYRMDGTEGDHTVIGPSDEREDIETRWGQSRSLISSVQYALSTERFHQLFEGAFGDRGHSPRFFDTLVLLGAESITEPEYHFLSDLADRVVLIGDRRGIEPEMVSQEATERGLDRSYFAWGHERYANSPTEQTASLQFTGQTNEFVQSLFPKTPWGTADAEFTFFDVEGDVATTETTLEVRASVRPHQGVPQRLVFDASDTTASPFAVQSTFEELEYLDATALTEGEVALIDDQSLLLRQKAELDSSAADHHQIIINSEATRTPAFSRAFLYNQAEARIIAQLAPEYEPDAVITAFASHANELRERLGEADVDIPVYLPEQVDAREVTRAIISFGSTSEVGILEDPLTNPALLYRMFTCADDMLLVGQGDSLRGLRDFKRLIDDISSEYTRPLETADTDTTSETGADPDQSAETAESDEQGDE